MNDPSTELAPALREDASAYAQTLALIHSFEVQDQASLDTMSGWVRQAKALWKERNAQREDITKPLWTAKSRVDALFKPILKALEAIEDVGKEKIASYHATVEAQRRATMIVSAAEHASGGLPTHVIEAPARTEGVTIISKWDFEVTDAEAVPRELCSPDPVKIRQAIAHADTETPPLDIPGLRWVRKDTVRVKT